MPRVNPIYRLDDHERAPVLESDGSRIVSGVSLSSARSRHADAAFNRLIL
jgi:hypothetical protein